jgi:excisionase family DNA binding protein
MGQRDGPALVTSGELARLVGVNLKTIHRWVRMQEVQGWQTVGRHRRFHRTEVVRLLRRLRAPVPPALAQAPCRFLAVGFLERGDLQRQVRAGHAAVCEGLFDAALALGKGHFELCLVDVEKFELRWMEQLLEALGRSPAAAGMASVGVARSAVMRRAFLRHGGYAVIPDLRELSTTLRWLVGGEQRPERLVTQLAGDENDGAERAVNQRRS